MNELIESHGEGAYGPQVLDRLVDGELSEAQRREVLTSLDHRPEGWRQCALAFLEAQCWGQTLGQMARGRIALDAPADPKPLAGHPAAQHPLAVSPSAHSLSSSHVGQRHWTRMLAMAASFLITLSLGMMVHQAWVKSAPGLGGAVVLPDGSNAVVAGNGYATMQIPEPNGGSRPVQLPLVEASALGQVRSQPQMSAIPDGARQALAQAGLQFRVTREYHYAILNGRPVFVAVNRVDLVPAGSQGGQ